MTRLARTRRTEKSVFPTISDKAEEGEILSAHFETLGCRLNQIESEGAADFFSHAGFRVEMKSVSAGDIEDESVCVCVLNTCAVTTKAEQKARRVVRLLLKKFPNAAIIVTGCYAQLSPEEIRSLGERVVVLPGLAKSSLRDIPQKIRAARNNASAHNPFPKNFIEAISGGNNSLDENPNCKIPAQNFSHAADCADKNQHTAFEKKIALEPFVFFSKEFVSHSRASLKIQDGCDNACSYCAIHLARGRSVSLAAEAVAERVAALEEAGHAEVVLTGVNVGQYAGMFGGKNIGIAELISLILSRTKKIAVRLSSVHPEIVDEAFCTAIQSERVRPHFHLSVQSGSDSLLQNMNRHYTRSDVLRACERLRGAKENPFLACDIITGFPGESEEDFSMTLGLLEECSFANVHAFPFSPRNGTPAFSMKPKIPERIKDARARMLAEFSVRQKIRYVELFVQSERRAVLESVHGKKIAVPRGKKILRAVTDNFIHTEILCDEQFSAPKEGSEIMVKIREAQRERIRAGGEWEAWGEISLQK